MVTDWILGVVSGFVAWLLGTLPRPSLPEWFGTVPQIILDGLDFATDLGAWFPLDAIAAGLALMLVLFAVALALKLLRIALSYVSLGDS